MYVHLYIFFIDRKRRNWGCDEGSVKRDLEIDLLQYVSLTHAYPIQIQRDREGLG
jgi:hypothetical protein